MARHPEHCRTVSPSDLRTADRGALQALPTDASALAELAVGDLPPALVETLADVVAALREGHAVTVTAHEDCMTTQEAADVLGVSRPTLVRLLEEGAIPYEQPGRHRRVRMRDVLAFQADHRHAVAPPA